MKTNTFKCSGPFPTSLTRRRWLGWRLTWLLLRRRLHSRHDAHWRKARKTARRERRHPWWGERKTSRDVERRRYGTSRRSAREASRRENRGCKLKRAVRLSARGTASAVWGTIAKRRAVATSAAETSTSPSGTGTQTAIFRGRHRNFINVGVLWKKIGIVVADGQLVLVARIVCLADRRLFPREGNVAIVYRKE